MLDDTMESVMDDPEDMEEEAQSEIDKVYLLIEYKHKFK